MTCTVSSLDAGESVARFFAKITYVTLKVTSGCNIRCSYCNMEVGGAKEPRMSMAVFRRIAEVFIQNATSKSLGLEFHGGEPLLLGDQWIAEAVAYAKSIAKKVNKVLLFRLQTNGILLTEKRLGLLRSLGVHFGISCDGPPHIHNRKRQGGNAVDRALRLAFSNGGSCGVLLVMSKVNFADMHEIMEYFRSLGICSFRVNFLQPQGWGRDEELLSADEMLFGTTECFRHMAETQCSVIEGQVQLAVSRFIRNRLVPAPLTCWEHNCQAGRTYVAIDHTGAIFTCGTDITQHQLGHIEDGFDTAHTRDTLRTLHKKDAWYTRCFDCSARRICSYSCATSDYNSAAYRENECAYTKKLFAYLSDRTDTVAQVHDQMIKRLPPTMYYL